MAEALNVTQLKSDLKRDEGIRYYPYIDSVGKCTIGVGHNLTDCGVQPVVVEDLLDYDVNEAVASLDSHLPWWRNLTEARQRALANMAFNLGIAGLLGFHNTLQYLQNGDYQNAADNMLKSKWASQVGDRAKRLATLIRNG